MNRVLELADYLDDLAAYYESINAYNNWKRCHQAAALIREQHEAFKEIMALEFAGSCCGCGSDDAFDEAQAIARHRHPRRSKGDKNN